MASLTNIAPAATSIGSLAQQLAFDSAEALSDARQPIPDTKGKGVAKPPSESPAQDRAVSPPVSPPSSPRRTTFSPQDSPSARTGPPRSFSYNLAKSTKSSKQSTMESSNIDEEGFFSDIEPEDAPPFNRATSEFRGALEYSDPDQRDKEREAFERRERQRQSRLAGDVWGVPLGRWLGISEEPQSITGHTPSIEEDATERGGGGRLSYFTSRLSGAISDSEKEPETKTVTSRRVSTEQAQGEAGHDTPDDVTPTPTPGPSRPQSYTRKPVSRSRSLPHFRRDSAKGGEPKWSIVRTLLPAVARQHKDMAPTEQTAAQPQTVNITDELIAGGLSALMLRLWFERDEHGNRRVPLLFHRLRVRISDSLAPLSGNKAVFRIECEYANGAARWVVYRQLRDFVTLHTHYRLSNVYNRNVDALPDFPRTSLPYFKFLKKESKERNREIRQSDFAILQRETLENYLVGLIRAVMFHPASNRLASFLEVSALSIALAQSGGWQAKAGMLRIEASGKQSNFGRKGLSWPEKKKVRWCCVRDSYLVALEEPGELAVWDVFLFDSEFKIERPRRYYRQVAKGLQLFHVDGEKEDEPDVDEQSEKEDHHAGVSRFGTFARVKDRVGKAFSFVNRSPKDDRHSTTVASISRRRSSTITSASSSVESDIHRTEARIDPSTNMNPLHEGDEAGMAHLPSNPDDLAAASGQKGKKKRPKDVSRHTFYISNSQTRLKLYAKNERQMLQWLTALEKTSKLSHWVGDNRFGSFAPIRLNVAAQWLVDGRDYMWNLSRAILLARECIYIHDWWLSPELQMRRPNKEKYRLDRLLERKAREGVKIYVILYQEVSNRTTPTDSNYAKQRLTALHPNIMVQRSPSHFQTGTYYWAHHEKLCVIDEAIAFMGGIDLCFGRWDTPQHVMLDDPSQTEGEAETIWTGKDYSNPRVSDFYALNKPHEDMYDRSKVPRMPWHDVGMNVVGQPARDLCRHFVQRWNFLLRIKKHTRKMPFLLPPPEFKAHDLQAQGLTGTLEMQICRSAGQWSMGTSHTEMSIQNAYLKAIQMSEHFVYIENQFFITSTVVNETTVENKIGDALVHRIMRAHRQGTPWKACIVIPLLPGFSFPIDHSDASAIRIIVECQNRTICRGPNSIFSRLRREGIDPDEYISFFSLRNWAKLPGNVLTTEQVYIHAKVCIVDDRLAIIGSANINERSQAGDRDSELAAIIKDTDMIDGTMAGKPFKVGRFAHTLRVRLMREHLGVDVDAMYDEDLLATQSTKSELHQEPDVSGNGQHHVNSIHGKNTHHVHSKGTAHVNGHALHAGVGNHTDQKPEAEQVAKEQANGHVPIIDTNDAASVKSSSAESRENSSSKETRADNAVPRGRTTSIRVTGEEAVVGAKKAARKHLASKLGNKNWTLPTPAPEVDSHGFDDPICDKFWKSTWVACANHNTEIYRKVFHAIPDDTVTTWKQYKEFVQYHERMTKPARDHANADTIARIPSGSNGDHGAGDAQNGALNPESGNKSDRAKSIANSSASTINNVDDSRPRAPSRTGVNEPFDRREREEMELLLRETRGHLVVYPTRFLEGEDAANNFLFNADRMLPMPIYA